MCQRGKTIWAVDAWIPWETEEDCDLLVGDLRREFSEQVAPVISVSVLIGYKPKLVSLLTGDPDKEKAEWILTKAKAFFLLHDCQRLCEKAEFKLDRLELWPDQEVA